MRKIGKRFGRLLYATVEAVLAFLVFYFVVFMGGGIVPVGDLHETGEIEIFVQSNGVHTDLCLPVETSFVDWKTYAPPADFPSCKTAEFIAIGWGDKGFFLDTPTWGDLTFKTAFNAAFLPSGTAMHVAYLEKKPLENNHIARVFLTPEEYQEMVTFVKNSFSLVNDKTVLIPNKGYWNNDNFYEANGSYHLFKTCNSWTNSALKRANVRTGCYALSAEGIMRHLH